MGDSCQARLPPPNTRVVDLPAMAAKMSPLEQRMSEHVEPRGLGIGLVVVCQITEAHDDGVGLLAQDGHGMLAALWFPLPMQGTSNNRCLPL